MSFVVVIPARYASIRLPGKPLLDINGKPMVQWVVDAASASSAQSVWVATDDMRIAQAVRNPRHSQSTNPQSIALMTRADHPSGTDRIAEVAAQLQLSDDTVVVNVQGDEPHMPAVLIDQVARLLLQDSNADLATLSTPIMSIDEFLDPNVVKVVSDTVGNAMYFSRAPIPWSRDSAVNGLSSQQSYPGAQRHLGIYAYRVHALRRMTAMPPGELEQTEKLEQLRALQSGMRIRIAQAMVLPGMGVDTPSDLERVRGAK
jgi:3-deoxy-manno-octulosonate cytidylyltransferase (CMP-KDO synthetase)